MKCVKSTASLTGENPQEDLNVVRVTDEKAAKMVAEGGWEYTSKRDWKATGRKRG